MIIGAESREKNVAVVTLQVVENNAHFLGAKVEKNGVHEVNNVETSEFAHRHSHVGNVAQSPEISGTSLQVYVARSVHPAAAVGRHNRLMSHAAERIGKGVVKIARIAHEKYLHDDNRL